MSTVPNAEHQPKPFLGQIKLSWKDAITVALTKRWRRHLTQSVVLSSIVGIFIIFQDGMATGLLRGLFYAVGMFIVNVAEDARLQRKASRHSWWVDPSVKTNWVE